MGPILRKILSAETAKSAAAGLFGKKGAPLCLGCVFHAETVQDAEVFGELKNFAEGLPFRPALCVMTPRNPYVKWDMERRKVSEREFTDRLLELAKKYDIGFHGHWCRAVSPGTAVKPFLAGRPTYIEEAGFELTMDEPEAVEAQFRDEYEYLARNFGRPAVYSAGWWVMNETIAALLGRLNFGADCSLRYGRTDSFGREYSAGGTLPPPGHPFRLPCSGSVTEFPSIFYLHMNWWTLAKELRPMLRREEGPLFAVLPIHDYNLPEGAERALDNIALLSHFGNTSWLSIADMLALSNKETGQ